MTTLTQHFSLDELRCRCGCTVSPTLQDRLRAVAESLEALRAAIDRPLVVISGHRCAERNRRVRGATRSRHIVGDAVDVQAAGMTGRDLARVAERLIASGMMREGGLGTYSDRLATLHYDQRGERARWHT